MTFRTRVSPAEKYSSVSPASCAIRVVDRNRIAPCQANSVMSCCVRLVDSMANEISSMPAASSFSNSTSRWDLSTGVGSEQKVNQQPEHCDQKGHCHELGSPEDA